MDDDEEILAALAQVLDSSFLECIGGPLFAPHLFKPLERLCEVEETNVREKVCFIIEVFIFFNRRFKASKTFFQ
jgi:hypothetical protein